MLNGFGRIIEFGTIYKDKNDEFNPTIHPNQNYVISISEGSFRQGLFSGYVRMFDNEGECKVGFWKQDTT